MNAAHSPIDSGSAKVFRENPRAPRRVRTSRKASWTRSILAGLCLLLAGVSAQAQTVTATVNAGKLPYAIAVNPVTNYTYVVNSGDNTVSAINGVTNVVTSIPVGTDPYAVAANPATNLIYVVNNNNGGAGTISVINGASNTVIGSPVSVGTNPAAVAVNPETNKIFVANAGSGSVTVIDATNGNLTTSVTVGSQPLALAVNPATNEIYVANYNGSSVSVINGASNSVASTITVGTNPVAVAVNPATNQIFVADYSSANVKVISGSNNSVASTVTTGSNPIGVAVNPVTNKIYVANATGANVTVIDGNNLGATPTTLGAGSSPIAVAVNPVTNQVYVANHGSTGSNGITVINGATNSAAATTSTTLSAGNGPRAIAVNPITGKIYVANLGTAGSASTVTVINGATNSIAPVSAGNEPYAVAVNPVTNRIYVTNYSGNTVTAIDGTGVNSPTSISVGSGPVAVAVNPVTNLIYVPNQFSNNLSIINGATNTVSSTLPMGGYPSAVAVNPVTNKIYVANYTGGTVTVVDGNNGNATTPVGVGSFPQAVAVNPATNEAYVVTALVDSNPFPTGFCVIIDGANNANGVAVGHNPIAVAVNPITNRAYVANFYDGTVTMIDGNNGNAATSISLDRSTSEPLSLDVNPFTNKIYVADSNESTLAVIDGATSTVTTLTVGQHPWAVAVNSVTNKIYVPNLGDTTVSVIDGSTNAISSFVSGNQPGSVAVNPVTNQVYVGNQQNFNVTVLTEQQVQAIPITTTIQPLAGNHSTSLTPTFTLSATNTLDGAQVDNVFYQVDTWQGPWTAATSQGGGSFSVTTAALQTGFHTLYAYATDGQEGTSNNTGLQSAPLIGNIAAYSFVVAPGGATVMPSSLTFASQEVTSSSGPQTVTLTNGGSAALSFTVSSTDSLEFPESSSDSCTAAHGQLAIGASCTISISFAPILPTGAKSATLTVTDNSNGIPGSTQTVSLSGTATGNVDPSISWAPPAAITYGTPLSATQLNATALAAGTFTYTPPAGTYLNAGANQNLTVMFTPNDPSTYTSAKLTVTITVNPAPLTVTASNATRPYGQPNPVFSASYTGFVHSDTIAVLSGLPSLTTSATALTPVGKNYAIVAAAGTLQATNYAFSFVNGTLTITQAIPPIIWGTPTPGPTTNYITSSVLGAQRNDATGWVGMAFTVGGSPITVSALGRMMTAGNTGSHTVKIVNASTSKDVPGGSVTISMAGGTPGQFVYANLPASITLNANGPYYIVTYETAGGDAWADISFMQTTSAASDTGAGYSADGANYFFNQSAGEAYGPLDFQYNVPIVQNGILPAIPFGTMLASSLNATSPAAGTFTYAANGVSVSPSTILPVGVQSLMATLIPTDTVDYVSPATATASLTVTKPAPTIVVTTTGTSTLKFGTPVTFSATISSLIGTPTGTVSFYNQASGATCAALGTSTLLGSAQTISGGSASVTTNTIAAGADTVLACYSGDATFLATGSTVSQMVNQAIPMVVWPQPAPINYGTALSAVQLNATVNNNLPGVFNYVPASGSVLGAGSQTLNLTFIPTDTIDYTTATTMVALMVNQAPPNSQATVTATVTLKTGPKAVAVNPVTNKIYVANVGSASVSVIDGATNSVTSIGVGNQPDAVAVNPVTNQIYAANYADGTVTAIDGTGNNPPSTITVGTHPTVIAVNSATNKIYVVNSGSGTVTIINANSNNATATVTVGTNPYAAAVNPVTNKIYVTNQGTNGANGSVSVIDGASNTVSATVTDPAASAPYSVAVNAASNKVYVTNLNSNTLTIIDPASGNSVTSIQVGMTPWAVAVNEVTNKVYVANYGAGTVTVIDPTKSNTTTPVTVGTNPDAVAVNPITDQIFVANLGSANFTVIDGSTNNPTNVSAGTSPVAVGVNPVTDKIYVANNGSGNVSVVDGSTNTTSATGTDAQPVAVAVNPATNTVYTANSNNPGSVTVINGSTASSVPVGEYPSALAVNPLTNKVYVVNLTNVTVIDGATNTPTAVNVGAGPNAVAINPVTNEVFFTNYNDNTVAVFNGATNAVITAVGVGAHPDAVAVNPVTNKIYVGNIGGGTVTVVDGTTNTPTATVTVGDWPLAIAVDPVTNKIYVANSNLDNYPNPGSVTVIDGVTNKTTTIPAGIEPYAIAVNPITNKIYVANKDGNSIMVLDGATNNTTFLTVGSAPFSIAVNPVTNKIYVPNAAPVSGSYYISVIDGATNFITTLSAGSQPVAAAVNLVTNQAYITNQNSSTVMALTEQQVQTIPITTTIHTLAGNQTTNLAPTFTFTATNTLTGAPVDNVFYQIDTWQGPWTPATSQGSGSFTATTGTILPGYHVIYAYATDSEEGTSTITGAQSSPLIGNIAAYGFAEVAQTGGAGASVSPSSMAFGGEIKTKTTPAQTATLVNASNATLNFSISFSGANKGDFAETTGSDTCSTLSGQLAPNGACTIGVTFTPSAIGSETATLTITDNSNGVAGSTQTVSLSGIGTGSGNPGLAWPTPGPVAYGTPLGASQLNATATVQGTFVYTPPAGTLLAVGPQTLSVTFTPNDTTDYAVATTTVQVTVAKATLTVTANNATRSYGQMNPVFTFNYTGFVNGDTSSVLTGSPIVTTTATISSNAGVYPITVTQGTLTASNYIFTFAAGANLTITPATTIITWGPLAPIGVGTALSSSQLNATATIAGGATVQGQFVYTPPAGTVLTVGAQTLSVSFTPTGATSANYTTASGMATLSVNQASLSFQSLDTTTQGNWIGVYGGDGSWIAPTYESLPGYATAQLPQNQPSYTWTNNTTDVRALQLPSGTGRIAATWYSGAAFTMAVNFTGSQQHQLALYALDWDATGRAETIQVVDAVAGTILDTENISNFTNGVYLVWNISGSVNIVVTPTAGNAVISGVFFGPSSTAENVTVKPASVNLSGGGTQQFTATVKNGTGQPTWKIGSVSPSSAAPGTVSSTGLYTAPASVTAAATVTVTATSADQTTTGTATVTLLPPSSGYITSSSPGPQRNNFNGWAGMTFTVGSSQITVSSLGRMFAAGNSGTHTVKIVNASTSQDVTGGSVSVSMSGGTPGKFVYAVFPAAITLNANTTYYVLSQEAIAGDTWGDLGSVQTTNVASETSAVYSADGAHYSGAGSANQAYVPVDFQYTVNLSAPVITQQPQGQAVATGAAATFSVTATGGNLTYQWESEAPGGSSFTAITGATASTYTTASTTLAQTGTQYMCVVTNTMGSANSTAATLTVAASLPTTNYVTSFSLGAQRNNFTGWVGMSFTVGGSSVTVSSLGRMFASGNSGSHTVKIVNASNSQDVAGGSVSVLMSGGTPGKFVYAALPASVTLNANTTYYVMSQETIAGDTWADLSSIQTTNVAAETSAVYSADGANYNGAGSANQSYVPVDFQYNISLAQPVITQQPQGQTVSTGTTPTFSVTATGGNLTYQWESEAPGGSSFTAITGATASTYTTPATTLAQSGTQYMCVVTNTVGSANSTAATLTVAASLPTTNYVTSVTPGKQRNNFNGWVGMSFTVGGSPVTVSALGRMFASGNSGTHTVKIVNASNSQDVAGGSVAISMVGGTPGQFVYATLPTSVSLNANTTYYIVSQEAVAGDTWSDITSIQTTSVAAENTGIWSPDGATYNLFGTANQAYVPVDFQYATTITQPTITKQPLGQTVSAGTTATFSITATGGNLTYQWESEAPGGSSFAAITGATTSTYTTPATTLAQTGTQYMCVVTNTLGSATSTAATLTVASMLLNSNYVTSVNLASQRNNFTGWVGMSFTVGGSPVTVSALGRMFASGNTGTHTVKIVNASNSQDVTGGSVAVSVAGGTPGQFVYANLSGTVTLNANTTYYIVSQEKTAGDTWADISSIQTASVAAETAGIWSPDGATYNLFGSANQAYVPVDFQYAVTLAQPMITQQPQSQTASASTTATFSVTATGGNLTYQWESEAPGGSSFTAINGATANAYTTPATTLGQSGTQYMCVVSNTIGSATSTAATLTVNNSVPSTNYVTAATPGSPRSDFNGWVGMSFTVGGSPVSVSALGRMFFSGNTGTHTVKIVNASNSQDVTGGSVTVSMAGGSTGSFVYASLPASVTLNANSTYFIVSQETMGGDKWGDLGSIQTTTAASENSAIWAYTGVAYNTIGSANQAYVPVDFKYTVTLAQPAITQQPQGQTASVGATATFSVTATGGNLTYQWESEAPGGSSFTAITGATASTYATPATTLAQTGTQYMCVVTNTVGTATSTAATLTVATSIPNTNYVTSFILGPQRNNFTGWVGMGFTVGGSQVTVSALGRMFAAGNSGTHTVKIVNASNSQDVTGGSVTISMSGGTPGQFVYANLPATVTLNANTTYYIVSQEKIAGDTWADISSIQTTSVAAETTGIWSADGATYNLFGSANQAYVPVDFEYTVTLAQPMFTQQPQNQTAGSGTTATFSVAATGGNLTYQWESEAPGGSSFTTVTGATASTYTTPATTLAQSGTQYMCVVTNTIGTATSNAATLTVVATPPSTNYVTSFTPGTQRNDFTGWVGMSFTVGGSPITVSALGRMFATGNTGSHVVKIVNASNSQDVTGGSVTVSMVGGTPGKFVYANLPASVMLSANTTYYVVSQEVIAGDTWSNITPIQTSSVAAETSGVWSPDGATYNLYGTANQAFVPVDFK